MGGYGEDMFVWESDQSQGYIGSDGNKGRSLMIDGDVLVFKQNWGPEPGIQYEIDDNWEQNGFQVTFNKETKECTQWYGPGMAHIYSPDYVHFYPPSFTRFVVNGVDFTDKLIMVE